MQRQKQLVALLLIAGILLVLLAMTFGTREHKARRVAMEDVEEWVARLQEGRDVVFEEPRRVGGSTSVRQVQRLRGLGKLDHIQRERVARRIRRSIRQHRDLQAKAYAGGDMSPEAIKDLASRGFSIELELAALRDIGSGNYWTTTPGTPLPPFQADVDVWPIVFSRAAVLNGRKVDVMIPVRLSANPRVRAAMESAREASQIRVAEVIQKFNSMDLGRRQARVADHFRAKAEFAALRKQIGALSESESSQRQELMARLGKARKRMISSPYVLVDRKHARLRRLGDR